MKKLFVIVCASLAGAGLGRADTITQWDFQTGNPSGTTAPAIGAGTIETIGGVTHTGFNSGNGSTDPVQPGQAYQTANFYPAQGTASGTAGIQVKVDTTGYEDIVITYDHRTSNTSSRWYKIQYTTDGVNYVDFGGPVRLERFNANNEEIGVGDFWNNTRTVDLSSIPAVENNPNFGFRVVSVFSPVAFTEFLSGTQYGANEAYEAARNRQFGGTASNYSPNGTWRFDMVTVSGTPISGSPASVVNQFVYYASWGGGGGPVDTTKQVYKQTSTPTALGFNNLVNASQGITGVGFEVTNLGNAANLSSSDFEIQISPTGVFNLVSNPPSGWASGPAPTVSVVPGSGSDQVRLEWSASVSAKNRWLRITMKATPNTGLASDEVFYIGHLLGETTGLDATVYTISSADISNIRAGNGSIVDAGSILDIDKNGTVAFLDIQVMRPNQGSQLSNITVP